MVGIIGRNGAGKSTLLKILSRITEPTDGPSATPRPRRLAARGRHRLSSRADRPREHLPERRDPRHDRAEIARKFDEIVAFAEVEQFIDTPVKRYSSGMYVRLAFAVAAHLEPEILIVDEVLAVGDAALPEEVPRQDAATSRRRGRTVLFVSHNMAAVQRLCTTAILLERGRVVFQGDPRSAVSRYLAGDGRARYIATSPGLARPCWTPR